MAISWRLLLVMLGGVAVVACSDPAPEGRWDAPAVVKIGLFVSADSEPMVPGQESGYTVELSTDDAARVGAPLVVRFGAVEVGSAIATIEYDDYFVELPGAVANVPCLVDPLLVYRPDGTLLLQIDDVCVVNHQLVLTILADERIPRFAGTEEP